MTKVKESSKRDKVSVMSLDLEEELYLEMIPYLMVKSKRVPKETIGMRCNGMRHSLAMM